MTDQGDWYTMQQLKNDLIRLRRLDPEEHRHEIDFNTEALSYFKKKVIVK